MSRLFEDTHPKVEAFQIELLRNAPPWRKLEMVDDLNRAVRALTWEGLHLRYPNADDIELRRQLAALLLGRSLAEKVGSDIARQAETGDGISSAA